MAAVIGVASAACVGGGGSGPDAGIDPGICEPVEGEANLVLRDLGLDIEKPLLVNSPPGDDRLFIMENQRGKIFIYRAGELLSEPFIDLEGEISDRFEQGLLGMAFHPQHDSNGKVYISYTVPITGDLAIVEFTTVAGQPDRLDRESGRPILTVAQKWSKHNGGSIHFGPDGYLYVATGDSLNNDLADQETSQDVTSLLGKILRIDVDGGTVGQPYAIPPDNPLVNEVTVRREIWHLGFRNPWQMYIDPESGTMYIPDVGTTIREELNIVEPDVSGLNFGYPMMEGTVCREDPCDESELEAPVLDYGRDEGCAIIGGTVYRGCRLPAYHGEYFFTDWCHGFVRSLEWSDGAIAQTREWPELIPPGAPGEGARVSSLVSGPNGELFLADHFDNKVYAVVAE